MSEWFSANKLALSLEKKNKPTKYIESANTKFLSLQIEDSD
jgi:hypothetical protein